MASPRLLGAGHLGQHRLLAGFDQRPVAEAEVVGVDHLLQALVRRRAGLDAVDLLVEGVGVGGEVLEVGDAELGRRRRSAPRG